MTAPHVVPFPEGDIWLLCFKRRKTDHRKCQYIPESRRLPLGHPVGGGGGGCLIVFIYSVHGNLSQLWFSEGKKKSFIRPGETAQLGKRLPCKQEDARLVPSPTFTTKPKARHSGRCLQPQHWEGWLQVKLSETIIKNEEQSRHASPCLAPAGSSNSELHFQDGNQPAFSIKI